MYLEWCIDVDITQTKSNAINEHLDPTLCAIFYVVMNVKYTYLLLFFILCYSICHQFLLTILNLLCY